jgi:hypothetical protein
MKAQMRITADIFLAHSANKLTEITGYLEVCLLQLTADQIWHHGVAQNSIGNLVLHLTGNVRQWIGSTIGGQPDIRKRDEEFAPVSKIETPELLARLNAAVGDALEILEDLPHLRLTEQVHTQDGERTVLEVIYQVVGHFQQHAGQVFYATKLLTGDDLKFYTHAKK